MKNMGASISDTYRNENGIAMQMSAMFYALTDGKEGLDHPSKAFCEMADLFNSDRQAYETILKEAKEYFEIDEFNITDRTPNIEKNEDDENLMLQYVADFKPNGYVNGKIKHILKHNFQQGYRLNSYMELKRLKRYYQEEFQTELNMEQEDIEEDVKACGIVVNERVYLPESILSDSKRTDLIDTIKEKFNSGTPYIYYKVLLREFQTLFDDSRISDEQMLRTYLLYNNDYHWFLGKQFMSVKPGVRVDVVQEVCNYIKEHYIPVTREDVIKALSYLPDDLVASAFDNRDCGLMSCGRNLRFHIDNFVISKEELHSIEHIIHKAITQFEFISMNELLNDIHNQLPSVIDNNAVFSDLGIRNVLSVLLSSRFSFYNNLISDKKHPLRTEDAFRALSRRETFTMDEVIQMADVFSTMPNAYIALLLEDSVRVSSDLFVSAKSVHFDVTATDKMLAKFCQGDYTALKDIETLSVFPECGYPWTEFLLESYVYNHSKGFKLLHARYFNQNSTSGGIVRKSSSIKDFDMLVAQAVIDDKIEPKESKILDFMKDRGYIAKRNYKDVPRILTYIYSLK
jgi:hypothetical protein